MNEQEAINIIYTEKSCVITNSNNSCDRNCLKCCLVRPDNKILQGYDMAIKALDKQIAKKPDTTPTYYKCPTCNNVRNIMVKSFYCENCGQKLDWS